MPAAIWLGEIAGVLVSLVALVVIWSALRVLGKRRLAMAQHGAGGAETGMTNEMKAMTAA